MHGEKLSHRCPQLLLLKKFGYNNKKVILSRGLITSIMRLA